LQFWVFAPFYLGRTLFVPPLVVFALLVVVIVAYPIQILHA
jgi:hypothetical protein